MSNVREGSISGFDTVNTGTFEITWKDEGFVLFGVVIAVICAVETSFFESAPKHTATVICGDGIAVDSVWEI